VETTQFYKVLNLRAHFSVRACVYTELRTVETYGTNENDLAWGGAFTLAQLSPNIRFVKVQNCRKFCVWLPILLGVLRATDLNDILWSNKYQLRRIIYYVVIKICMVYKTVMR
jgi:hypothetical protein